MYSCFTFVAWKCTKYTQKSNICSFWPIFGPPIPQNSRLYYQRSTFRGSYSVKCFHKLVLQENVSNPVFFELKVHLQCLKVGVRGQNLQNSTLKWPINLKKCFKHHNFWSKFAYYLYFMGKVIKLSLSNLFFNLWLI